jgi:hypothetical protein
MFLSKLLLLILIVLAARRFFQSRQAPMQGEPPPTAGNGRGARAGTTAPALDLVKCPACGDYVSMDGGAACAQPNCPSNRTR